MKNSPESTGARRHGLRWLLLFVLLAGIATVIGLPGYPARLRVEIQARIDGLKKAGYPVTARDLEKRFPSLPGESNSFLIYQKAFVAYVSPTNVGDWPFISTSQYPFRTQPLPSASKESIANFLATNQAALDLLHQAALIENGCYPTTFRGGFSTTFALSIGQLMQARGSAQLLAVAAVFRAEEGNPRQAAGAVLDSLGLPRSLKKSPEILPAMIGVATFGLSCEALEIVLNQAAFSDEQLRTLATALDDAAPTGGTKDLLLAARCREIWYWGMETNGTFQLQGTKLTDRLKSILLHGHFFREQDFLSFLDVMDEYVAAADTPYPGRLETAQRISLKSTASTADTGATGSFSMVQWDKVFVSQARIEAQSRMARTALALERFRLANQGKIPDELSALVPAFLAAVPTDPFTGRPLGYKRLPRGYRLHSLGADGIQQAGMASPMVGENTASTPSDLTFTVER